MVTVENLSARVKCDIRAVEDSSVFLPFWGTSGTLARIRRFSGLRAHRALLFLYWPLLQLVDGCFIFGGISYRNFRGHANKYIFFFNDLRKQKVPSFLAGASVFVTRRLWASTAITYYR